MLAHGAKRLARLRPSQYSASYSLNSCSFSPITTSIHRPLGLRMLTRIPTLLLNTHSYTTMYMDITLPLVKEFIPIHI